MKKLVAVLLVILIVASCCALSACQESCDKRGYHNYVSYKCKDCGATRCIEEDHKWIIGEDGKPVFTQCVYCNAADCDKGEHSYVKGECTKCGKTNCDKGFHAFEEGKCNWCGKSRCKLDRHEYDDNDVCIWCKKTKCKIEGHFWSKGKCLRCKKTSAFAWIYDIEKPVGTPDQGGNQGGTSNWNSTCPSGDGSHGWVNGECLYCGAVLTGADSMKFWQSIEHGLLTIAFMLVITVISALIYWLGAAFNWNFVTWIAHGIMLLIAFGIFLVYHWIWGIVFFVVFGGLYLLACSLISQRYSYHGSNFY